MTLALILLLVAFALAAVVAALIATFAGVLAWLEGASAPNAVVRAGIAFGGALTLQILVLGVAVTALR